MARGIVIQIQGDGESAKRALEMVQQKMQETEATGSRFASTMSRTGSASSHAVPGMAAASAGLRALEGNFTNNIRAGERFLTMIPGMADVLQTAFPAVGAIVLATALIKVGEEAYHAFQNISMLKGAIDGLNALDITVAKKLKKAADQTESTLEEITEKTKGKQAAAQQKLAYQSKQGLDLSDYFYDDKFKSLPTNVKANYETLYKDIAPQDLPDRLSRIRGEITALNGALAYSKSDASGGFTQRVGGFGPGMLQDSEKYYNARLKAANQIRQQLEAESNLRGVKLQKDTLDANTADKAQRTAKAPSLNPIAEAAAQLQQEQAKLLLDQQKSSDAAQMAELETQHKLMLVGDQDFYKQKWDLQNADLDAEQGALDARRKTLEALKQRQHDDPTLKKDKDGNKAEELKTQRELVQLQEQQAQLDERRHAAESQYNAEAGASSLAAEIAGLKLAAELERERGEGTAAQIALLQKEAELEAQKVRNAGGSDSDVQAVRDSATLSAQKLQMNDVDQQIVRTMGEYDRQVQAVTDRVQKRTESERAGHREIAGDRQAEVTAVQDLVRRYQELADASGNPELIEHARQLQDTLSRIGQDDRRGTFGQEVIQGMQSMTTSLAEQAAYGKASVSDMARSILRDLSQLAIKLAEQKLILPMFEAAMSGSGRSGGGPGGWTGGLSSILSSVLGGGSTVGTGGSFPLNGSELNIDSSMWEHHESGGLGGDGPQVVGEKGIELWTPPSGGGSYTSTDMLKSLAEKGSAARTPQVTSNVINKSGVPLTSSTPKVDYKTQLGHLIVETVLDKHAEGGPLRDLFGS